MQGFIEGRSQEPSFHGTKGGGKLLVLEWPTEFSL